LSARLLTLCLSQRLYSVSLKGQPCIVKERFKKLYRHPDLDAKLTARRSNTEVRIMRKCRQYGLDTPEIYMFDADNYRIFMERVAGKTIKDHLRAIDLSDPSNLQIAQELAASIGGVLAKLHTNNIVHGDLTTSNMMLRDNGSLVLLDFGLSYSSSQVEDKAVDLYVLERALSSTHPNSDFLAGKILEVYSAEKGSAKVLERLEEVRARGRKRVMAG